MLDKPSRKPGGVRRDVVLRLPPGDARGGRGDLHDGHPPTFTVDGLPLALQEVFLPQIGRPRT